MRDAAIEEMYNAIEPLAPHRPDLEALYDVGYRLVGKEVSERDFESLLQLQLDRSNSALATAANIMRRYVITKKVEL